VIRRRTKVKSRATEVSDAADDPVHAEPLAPGTA
jgi:hypothetical protein